jgi:peptide/nickel transport system permease protein
MLDPRALERFRKNRGGVIGLALVTLVMLTALVGPFVSPHPPNQQFSEGLLSDGRPHAPSPAFLLGADSLGRDELSRLLHGGKVSMQVALFATALATLIGLSVGIATGYLGGVTDQIGMRLVDILLSLPFLLVAIAINRAVSTPSVFSLYVLLGCLSWPALARVTRTKAMHVRELDYVQAARALGVRPFSIVFRHVLPNVLGPAIVLATTMIADMIIAESAMSFLGLGVQQPQASWGSMLHEGRDMIAHAPLLLVCPAVLISMAVFGFNLTGEGLRDALDPKA